MEWVNTVGSPKSFVPFFPLPGQRPYAPHPKGSCAKINNFLLNEAILNIYIYIDSRDT